MKEFSMKRLFAFLVVLFLAVTVCVSCSAQSGTGSANNEQRVIGTWAEPYGAIWIFESNGKLTRTYDGRVREYRYAVAGTKFVFEDADDFTDDPEDTYSDTIRVFDIAISADGKNLVISRHDLHEGTAGYWLIRK
jgi:hypothetical protein